MKKNVKNLFKSLLLSTSLLSLVAMSACATPPTAAPTAAPATSVATVAPVAAFATTAIGNDVTNVDEDGNTTIDEAALSDALSQVSTGTSALSDADAEGLFFMREEEKLARDVYLTLYEKWGLPIFQNIANAEQTHTDAVKTLIDRYDLPDPALDTEIGVFTNPTLQELYDQLVDEGSKSLESALRVGVAIEEIDILDLEERRTDTVDIQLVYDNLTKGSRNHLRSFVSTLEKQTGETYQPQYLSQAAYDAIINTPAERGRK